MGEWGAAVAGEWNRRIDHNFTARNLTANGGFLLFVRFLKSLEFERVVGAHLEVKRSWRRYSTVELLTCLISMIVLGVERISHRDCLGEDRAFLEMLDWRDSPPPQPCIDYRD